MKLVQVVYEIFDSDAQWLDEDDSRPIHEIDREIRLVDDNGKNTFISWTSHADHYFKVGIADVPFFNEPIPITRDMSDSILWKDLVGKNVSLDFDDTNHQVLRISNTENAVYCWTSEFAETGLDILFISQQKP